MFKINTQTNSISPLEVKSFSSLGFTERHHLQEWLEASPQALGEELLIIQKEFDGFDDTRERLDLLALDKDGNLVIIENKLDDSGRDVVWQALKYASYCANLSKAQVIEIYQRYLNQKAFHSEAVAEKAEDKILEFLDNVSDLDEAIINRGKSQRLMFVAANYRKEVTNTALWLSQFGIGSQCFKATPYQSGEELFINIEQIIPTPESKEFMIGMVAKEQEEKAADTELKNRHKLRLNFWEQTLEAFHKSSCTLFQNINPSKDHWLNAGSGLRSMPFALIFGKNEVRVEMTMGRAEKEINSFAFDFLHSRKSEIESVFGNELTWLPLPDKKACRIQYAMPVDGYDRANWFEMTQWLVEKMTKFEQSLRNPLDLLNQELKNNPQIGQDEE
jgi:hypothetical protein